MMAAALKLKKAFNRLKSVFSLQKSCNSVAEGASGAGRSAHSNPNIKSTGSTCVDVDTSKWKKVDSRALGIRLSMFSHASKTVVRVLQNEGHDAYLVGGCVRDLLLNKIPKDFDVITTANLQEIKKKFHRALIVGRRFPICMVHIMGSEIEVSSFETVARHKKGKEKVPLPEVPKGYDEKDLMCWENSLHRDFTVNSMFYDPFAHKIYDYSNGMADLTAMKLRTVVPAYSSFQEDRARILRGLRIAARLGFSFANDTEKAVLNLCSSIQNLDKAEAEAEVEDTISVRKVQKADREKLRRDRLNEQFQDLGNALDGERPKNDKATILTDAMQILRDLTAEVNELKAECATLSEESCELTQEKNELREEKSYLKSDIESLNSRYQQRLRVAFPWGAVEPSVIMGPSYSYPLPVAHSLQTCPFFGSQNASAMPSPYPAYMPYSTPPNPNFEQRPTTPPTIPTTSHEMSKSRSKASDSGKVGHFEKTDDSSDIATELELKNPGCGLHQESSCGVRKDKQSQKKEMNAADGGSSSKLSSSNSVSHILKSD